MCPPRSDFNKFNNNNLIAAYLGKLRLKTGHLTLGLGLGLAWRRLEYSVKISFGLVSLCGPGGAPIKKWCPSIVLNEFPGGYMPHGSRMYSLSSHPHGPGGASTEYKFQL